MERPREAVTVGQRRQAEPQRQAWPTCRGCRRVAQPGLECAADRCPWNRVDGRIRG